MKQCSDCRETKPRCDFNKRSASRDGLAYRCRTCDNASSRKWRAENPEQNRVMKAKWYQSNRERADKKTKTYVETNPERRSAISKRYYSSHKIEHASRVKSWRNLNPDKKRAIAMKRHAAKMNATPVWLSDEQKSQIVDVYALARDCEVTSGLPYEVDHIVPLQGENVCGLHVPWNLQVLPRDVNRAKWNTHDD